MVLNADNRNYSVDMELLCLLSLTPAALADLADDLGFALLGDVRACIERLILRGFQIRTSQRKSGIFVSITKKQWPAIQIVCERYWRTVYGI